MSAASMSAAFSPSPPSGLDRCAASPNRNRRPSLRRSTDALVHLEVGDTQRRSLSPTSTPVRASSSAPSSAAVGSSWPRIGLVAIDENQPAVFRQRREQDEPGRPDDEPAAFGRAGKADFRVGDPVAAIVGLSGEMLLHRMARDAMAAARAQHVGLVTISVRPPASSVTRRPSGTSSIDFTSVPNSISTPRLSRCSRRIVSVRHCGRLHWNP